MTTGVAGGDGAAVISFLRLHYGKLAEGAERRVPPSAGYAVTRRSRGLDPAVEPLLSPSRLTGLRRVEPDAIDVDARGAGCFVARGVGENMVFMRARFRPEDGEGGFGRLHQQSAIWVTAFDAWRGHPAGCLSVAAEELRALPDLVGEAEAGRLDDAPLRWRVSRPDPEGVRRVVERAPWGLAMLEMLVDGAERGGDALMDFGAHDFVSERDFLAAVGFVLQLLPAAYPRWRDVAVVSGLTHALPGLCLRYAPSWRRVRAAA
jgi:hypothetical protein